MALALYMETYGCQMNVADSELITGIFAENGYKVVDAPDDADVALLNTCAIRDRAEERIFGRLGWLKTTKTENPRLVIVVAGCMAVQSEQRIAARAPYVDLVIGPDSYRRLPELVQQVRRNRDAMPVDAVSKNTRRIGPLIDVQLDKSELYTEITPQRVPGVSGWITIMRGCNKFCTFCVVPYVRGRERSVEPDAVVREAVQLQNDGFKEVTLLGQTVTGYHANGCNFAALLRRIHAATDLRIRFTSPYPTDFDDELIATLGELPRVGRHLHLPLQSGSTPILTDMRRKYAAEQFESLADQIHTHLPDFAITTDIIVGYPGETDADFECTLELSRRIRFDSAFMFKYSERPGTMAAKRRTDDVPEATKSERLQRLIELQEQSSRLRNGAMIGKRVEVLISGPNPKQSDSSMGRSSCFRPTVVPGEFLPGDIVVADVVDASTHTLHANPVEKDCGDWAEAGCGSCGTNKRQAVV